MPPHLGAAGNNNTNNGNDSLDPQLVIARAELAALQHRYDALHADRDRLAHLLEENMRKYKRFKRWVFLKVPPPKVKAETPLPQQQTQPTIKMLETPITHRKSSRSLLRSRTPVASSPRKSPLSPSRRILNTPPKRRVLSEGSPSTCRLKRSRDENDSLDTVEDTSQTQDDSQALTFWHPSTPSQRDRDRDHDRDRTIKRSPSTTTTCPSISIPTPPTKRASTSAPPVSRYRKRARNDSPAINAEFEIDPVANAGVPFAFDDVVRGRRHRHALDAGDCEECRDWYAAVKPLPPRLEAPRWSSSPPPLPPSSPTLVPSECNSSTATTSTTKSTARAHRQAVSRHRAQWERAPTPPGYWEIGFPDTQAVEKINEKAAELHRQKRAAIAKEAKGAGGRYRRRGGARP